ncbi:hypothetical protein [Bifidobacterium simiarum]|uniref:hypothetical protein n=1 Tax=Bifidobacterium simiarum TaxID=2045441 RepID=UPI001BDD9588|nr:hypothetical protein [Bifidobacterium simiarum]MBT1167279.1 hypothetical protein [Bifidobacterium simiarum]
MKDETEQRDIADLLDILLDRIREEHQPSVRDLDRIDGMIRSQATGDPTKDPDIWGTYLWVTLLEPVDRILDALGERRLREHHDPAKPWPEGRSRWMAARIWSRWSRIEDRLAALVEMIDGTTLCEADKTRYLLRRRLTELMEGTESGDFERGDDAFWIPESGEWREWRTVVDMCVADRMTPDALTVTVTMMSRPVSPNQTEEDGKA